MHSSSIQHEIDYSTLLGDFFSIGADSTTSIQIALGFN